MRWHFGKILLKLIKMIIFLLICFIKNLKTKLKTSYLKKIKEKI